MASPDDVRERLADLMEDRRADLRLRWEDVASLGGISVKALHDARNGNSRPRRNTLRGIDAGLQWEPGSAERILAGGDPAALNGHPGSLSVLGASLAQRRATLASRWAARDAFASEHGIPLATVTDLETGRRSTFTPAEVSALAPAYGYDPATLQQAIASGELPAADNGGSAEEMAAGHLRRTPGASQAEIDAYLEILRAFGPVREAQHRHGDY